MNWNQTDEVHYETYWSTWWPEAAEAQKYTVETNENKREALSSHETTETSTTNSEEETGGDENRSEASVQLEKGAAGSKKKKKKLLKEIKEAIDKLDERIEKIQSNAYQVASYYFVFQGVIFTAISNSSTSLKCRDVWFPTVLSLISGLLITFTLYMRAKKYQTCLEVQDDNWRKYLPLLQQVNEGEKKEATYSAKGRYSLPSEDQDRLMGLKRKFLIYGSLLLFVCFSCFTFFGCFWMLCRENQFKQLYDVSKCVKLCGDVQCIRVCPQ